MGCYIKNDTTTWYNLNNNDNMIVRSDDWIQCSVDQSNLNENMNDTGRILDCVADDDNSNSNNVYWRTRVSSCDLNELNNNYNGLTFHIAYELNKKNITDAMNSGSKQVRMLSYPTSTLSRLYTTFNKIEGDSISGTAYAICNENGSWTIESSGIINYAYTGNVQTFTPSYYGASGKSLTLEVWGGRGGDTGGRNGGYSKGISKQPVNNNIFYVVVGGAGNGANGGYNGGGNGTGIYLEGGGGATHIASADGLLETLESNKNSIFIVAGAGGGGNENGGPNGTGTHGSDGGRNNGNGLDGATYDAYTYGRGGTATASGDGGAYESAVAGSGGIGFGGFGENTNSCYDSSYYGGGGGGCAAGCCNGSGGGSAFCGNGTTNCSGNSNYQTGNGYAKISWMDIVEVVGRIRINLI